MTDEIVKLIKFKIKDTWFVFNNISFGLFIALAASLFIISLWLAFTINNPQKITNNIGQNEIFNPSCHIENISRIQKYVHGTDYIPNVLSADCGNFTNYSLSSKSFFINYNESEPVYCNITTQIKTCEYQTSV